MKTITQTAHTPGPWVNEYPYIKAGSALLARIECTPEMDKYDEANARLIATAPELYQLSKLLLERYEFRHQWNQADEREVFILLQAAIAKAEGRA